MTPTKTARLLVVDDSATVRAVLRRLFSHVLDIEIVAEATNGSDAVDAVLRHEPDVVLMDIEMPVLDGFAATERIMAVRPTPIVILTSRANRDQLHTAFEATRHGAVDLYAKPEDPAGWDSLFQELPRAVRTAALLTATLPRRSSRPPARAARAQRSLRPLRYVAIGASTGGPGALRELLATFPARPPVTVLVVQHIAAGFEEGLAEWLAKEVSLDVRVAADGETPGPGAVRLAPQGAHLRLQRDGSLQLDRETPPRSGHRPSADELFISCAAQHPRATAGVVLTGMGRDGAEGLAALRAAGGLTMVQDEPSSVVFGMPRAALDAGAAKLSLPPEALGSALVECWEGTKA